MQPASDRPQHRDQIRLLLEADPRSFRQRDVPVLDSHRVGEAAERLEEIGIGLVAAESESRSDVQGKLVAAVRDAAAPGPGLGAPPLESAQVLDESVARGAVELEDVAVGPHPAVAEEIARVLM